MDDPQNRIKHHLLEGGRITVLSGLRMFQTTETRRIISRLKKQGVLISDTWRKNIDTGKRFKEWRVECS